MRRSLYILLAAQFLTAFADNAILFTAFAMINAADAGQWYKPALQASFLVAFVVLAPWVGRLADRHAKRNVLALGNALKAAGTVLLLVGLDPLAAYALVGVGAAVYGPAKYGILPELVGHERLVRANGLVEGSTIIAIVLGAVIGAHMADQSIALALALIAMAYLTSLLGALLIPSRVTRGIANGPALRQFTGLIRGFLATPRARFAMLGASLFWAAAVVLRVMLVAWAPVVLLTATTAEVANLTVFIAGGIALGSLLVPYVVPIENLRRARLAAYAMGLLIILLGTTSEPTVAKALLLVIGTAGGIFVVPINATLQELGHRTIGAGGAVAIQNFFENLAMLAGTGVYTLALGRGLDPVIGVFALGAILMAATFLVSWHLPKSPDRPVQVAPEKA